MKEPVKVVSLYGDPVSQGEPEPSVVALLERALEQARSGEVCGVILVREYHDKSVSHDRFGHTNILKCVGALECAKHDLIQKVI